MIFFKKGFCFLFLLIFCSFSVTAALSDAQFFLNMDDNNATVMDSSNYNRHFTRYNNFDYNSSGKIDGAYSSAPSDGHVITAAKPAYNGSYLTYGGWFYLGSRGNPAAFTSTLMSNHDVAGDDGVTLFDNGVWATNTNKFECQAGDGVTWASDIVRSSAHAGTGWFNIYCVKNGLTNFSIYVNGVLENTTSSSVSISESSNALWLHGDSDLASEAAMSVTYDLIGFWSEALTSSNIATLYNSGAGSKPIFTGYYTVIATDFYNDSLAAGVNVTFKTGCTQLTNTLGEATVTPLTSGCTGINGTLTGVSLAKNGYSFNTTNFALAENTTAHVGTYQHILNITQILGYNSTALSIAGNISTEGGKTYTLNNLTVYLLQGSNNFNYTRQGYYPRVFTGISLTGNTSNYNITSLTNTYLSFLGDAFGNTDYSASVYCTLSGAALTSIDTYYYMFPTGVNQIDCIATSSYPAFSENITLVANVTKNVTINITEYKLSLTFDTNTTGIIYWPDPSGAGIRNWTNGTLIYATSSFCDGTTPCYVNVEFNGDNSGKQVYEYYNTYSSTQEASLHVMANGSMDSYIYFQTVGYGNDPLSEVKLQLYRLDDGTGNENYSLLGQRYTNPDGTQTFYTGDEDYIMIKAVKSGFTLYVETLSIDEFTNVSIDAPYKILMEPSSSTTVYNDVVYVFPFDLDNETPLVGFWIETNDDYYDYNTSYYSTLTRVTPNSLDVIYETLDKGTHYTNADLTLYFFDENGINTYNYTMLYTAKSRRDVTLSLDSITGAFRKPFLLILLIGISILIGAYIQTDIGTSGFHIFMVGGVIITIIEWTFWPIAVVSALFYAGQLLFRTTEA